MQFTLWTLSQEPLQTAGEKQLPHFTTVFLMKVQIYLRFRELSSKVISSSTFIEVHTFPSTSDAPRLHGFRIYQTLEYRRYKTGEGLMTGKLLPVKPINARENRRGNK